MYVNTTPPQTEHRKHYRKHKSIWFIYIGIIIFPHPVFPPKLTKFGPYSLNKFIL
jgi:hypothetical protein